MTLLTNRTVGQPAPDPQPIFDTAAGFMRAKHLFCGG
jgi:hypothetical protein